MKTNKVISIIEGVLRETTYWTDLEIEQEAIKIWRKANPLTFEDLFYQDNNFYLLEVVD